MVYWKKLMVYNGIVMDLISVMVSIGLLLLFLSRGRIRNLRISVGIEKEVVKMEIGL